MNNCILMAEIVQAPQLRYTADSQTAVAEMMVEFSPLRSDDPPATIKVIGWGNLAQEIQDTYQVGDRVILEGRLGMNTIEVRDGSNPSYKEKRAELTVQRVHKLGSDTSLTSSASPMATGGAAPAATAAPMAAPAASPASSPAPSGKAPKAKTPKAPVSEPDAAPPATTEADFDDIPF